jgi:2-oxoglutarate ferredoxin oxidoreductase subunit beta
MADINQFTTSIKPTFCPGCGNYGIMEALKQALAQLALTPDKTVICYDVGCNANMADFIYTYGFHGLHGRSVPPAAGIKLANHDLAVLALIGDGAFYGEGSEHFLSLVRGNHDITVLVHDNQRYSLTTGQYSPTTPKGTVTPSTPEGSIEEPLDPLSIALVNHGTFVARGFAGDIPHLKDLIIAGVNHKGFSLIEILQPCVVWNKEKSYDWYRQRVYKLEKPKWQANNRLQALEKAQDEEKLAIGIFYQETKKAYHEEVSSLQGEPLTKQSIEKIDISKLVEEFK